MPAPRASRAPTTERSLKRDVAQDRLEELVEESGIHNLLLEGLEWSSALGGHYLRPVWDKNLTDRPLLSVVRADEAVPEFRFGVLTAVTFHQKLPSDDDQIYRYLERHEPGKILVGLYVTKDPECSAGRCELNAPSRHQRR